jgi:hypothetical protein
MTTALAILALTTLVALVVGQLQLNDRRARTRPWQAPAGAPPDRDGERVSLEASAARSAATSIRSITSAATHDRVRSATGTAHRSLPRDVRAA